VPCKDSLNRRWDDTHRFREERRVKKKTEEADKSDVARQECFCDYIINELSTSSILVMRLS
jgi:hypothetical protein